MKPIWLAPVCLVLLTFVAAAQPSAPISATSTPVTASTPAQAPVPVPVPTASASTIVQASDIAALQQDIASLLKTTAKIAKTQEDEGSLLLKVRDGFITNILWELFGFKNTEKTIAGYVISLLGIFGLLLKAVWFISKNGKPEPAWAIGLTYAYLLVVVSVFSLLAFSGGVASELPASNAAARPLLDATTRLEAAVTSRLGELDKKLEKLSSPVHASSAASTTDPRLADALSGLRQELKAVQSTSETAARMSTDAAERSTGWGWHLFIALLLLGVLAMQATLFSRT